MKFQDVSKYVNEFSSMKLSLLVYSSQRLIKTLEIEEKDKEELISTPLLYGLPVLERSWVNKNQALLVDSKGKIVKVFSI